MICQGVPPRRLKLPPPHTLDDEEKAFLTEVAVSSRLEVLDKQQRDEEIEKERLTKIADDTLREVWPAQPSSSMPRASQQCQLQFH